MPKPVRRLVTGRDENGRSIVLFDGPAPTQIENPGWPGMGASVIWRTEVPAPVSGDADPTAGAPPTLPPSSGLNFLIATVPPEAEYERMTPEQQRAARGFGEHLNEDAIAPEDAATGMHSTPTLDFDVVLSGRITLVLDSGEYELGPGDSVVVRGDRHYWRNYGTEPAIVALIFVDAKAGD